MDGWSGEQIPIIGREGLLRLARVAERLRPSEGKEAVCATRVLSAPDAGAGGSGRGVWDLLPEVNRLAAVRHLVRLASRAMAIAAGER